MIAAAANGTAINGIAILNGRLDVNADGVNGANDDRAALALATTTSDADGRYLFSGLLDGDYQVRVGGGLPSGLAQTTDADETGACAICDQLGYARISGDSTDVTVDFGYRPAAGTAAIGDRLWSDVDGDAVQDAGEAGIGGVEVRLCNDGSCGTVYAATTTDPDGSYLFSNLVPNTYTVVVTPPIGYTPTYDQDGTGTANNATLTVAAGDIATTVDFGYRNTTTAAGSIGDTVYTDTDGNGVQDVAETGIDGVTLNLVTLGIINGYVDRNADSLITAGDAGTFGGYNLVGGAVDISGNGSVGPEDDGTANGIAVIDGRLDLNGDGAVDGADNRFPQVVATTATAGGGNYAFTGLAAGDYRVVVTDVANALAGTTATQVSDGAIAIACPSGCTNDVNADFGYRSQVLGSGVIGDTLYFDSDGSGSQGGGEIGIGGVTLDLIACGTGTCADGDESIVATTTTSDGTTDVDGDGNADPIGTYRFDGLAAGAYQVAVSDTNGVLVGLTVTETAAVTSIACGGGSPPCTLDLDADFGYPSTSGGTGSLGGTLWRDTNQASATGVLDPGEPRIQGVSVELWLDVNGNGIIEPGTDNLVRTTTTNANGDYLFLGLPPGNYIVDGHRRQRRPHRHDERDRAKPDGGQQRPPEPYAITLTLARVDTSVDFGYQASDRDCLRHQRCGVRGCRHQPRHLRRPDLRRR